MGRATNGNDDARVAVARREVLTRKFFEIGPVVRHDRHFVRRRVCHLTFVGRAEHAGLDRRGHHKPARAQQNAEQCADVFVEIGMYEERVHWGFVAGSIRSSGTRFRSMCPVISSG